MACSRWRWFGRTLLQRLGCPTGRVLCAFTRLARTWRDEPPHDGEDGVGGVNSGVLEQRREPANSDGHAPAIWLHTKKLNQGSGDAHGLGERKRGEREMGENPCSHQNRARTATTVVNSGEKFLHPGGAIRKGRRGEIERSTRAFYRIQRCSIWWSNWSAINSTINDRKFSPRG